MRAQRLVLLLAACLTTSTLQAEPAGHITGVGGVFFKSKDPKALLAWYRDVLGISIAPWGGAMLRYDAPGHPPMVVWSPFPQSTDQMAPSTREFMINFGVDDLDLFAKTLATKGVTISERQESDDGKFGSIIDPDGTKIQFWEPKAKPPIATKP